MELLPITIERSVYQVIQLPGRPKALLDRTVAQIYGVETKHINQAVSRNQEKFPPDFCFELTEEEMENLKSQIVTSNSREFNRGNPKAFTWEGCNMLATILKSDVAIRRCVQIIRAFTRLERTAPEDLNQLACLDRVFIKAIVNELGEIHSEMLQSKEEIKRKHASLDQRLTAIENRLRRIEAGMVGLSSTRALPTPPSDPETWIDPRQAAMLRSLAKEKGRTRQRIAGIWKEFKLHFGVDRYVHLPAARFQEALEWMRSR